MVDKINVPPLGSPLPDDGSFSEIQDEFENCYASIFDSSFPALSRKIVLHLTPTKVIDTSGVQASTPAVRYNPFAGRAGRRVPSTISTTRVPAVIITHRDVEYDAHIKHGPKNEDDDGGITLLKNEVLTTTILASQSHLSSAISATIDNKRYELQWSKPIGYRDLRYIISKWRAINEAQNG
jgi:hypothetical protein